MSAIDDYLTQIDQPQRTELERLRRIIKETVPDATEVISYGMPGFKYHGKYLAGYYAFKDHLSLFPTTWPIEVCLDELKDFKTSKGTIQFTLEHTIPELLIRKLILTRAADIGKS